MQHLNQRLIMAVVALLVVCGVSLSSASAFAEGGTGDSGSGETTTTSGSGSSSDSNSGSGSSSDSDTNDDSSTDTTATETETHSPGELVRQFKSQGHEKVQAELKNKGQERAQGARQKSCEARKANMTKRMNNMDRFAQKHKEVFDKIYDKVKAFKEDKNLTVDNYDQLVAAVDTAQADAQAKIDALKSLDVTVDCTQSNVADSVSTFRAAASSTRDSLKAYRKSIVSLIVAVHQSADKSDSSSDNESSN